MLEQPRQYTGFVLPIKGQLIAQQVWASNKRGFPTTVCSALEVRSVTDLLDSPSGSHCKDNSKKRRNHAGDSSNILLGMEMPRAGGTDGQDRQDKQMHLPNSLEYFTFLEGKKG